MKSGKIGALFFMIIFCLAGIGMSYAGFTETLNIFGTVQTATVEFNIESYSGTWVYKVYGGASPPANEIYVDYIGLTMMELETMFPGSTIELISYAEAGPDPTGDYDVLFEFDNLFPCVDFIADFVFTVGTIPVKVNEIDVGPLPGSEWMMQLILDGDIYATMWDADDNPVEIGTQIHPGEQIFVKLHFHLPQNNMYQGRSGSGQATLGIIQWTDDCFQQQEDKIVNLPEFPVTMIGTLNDPVSYWNHLIGGIGPEGTGDGDGPYNVWDGNWVGWCVDKDTFITPGHTYDITLYSSYDPDIPYPDDDWPNVNWIINHKSDFPDATWVDIQDAIWFFIDHGSVPTTPQGIAIRDAALPHSDFVPQTGQLVAVLCWAGECVQKTFIEVDP